MVEYTPKQFIIEVAPHAQKNQKKTGLLASLVIAQAMLESRNGNSDLAQKGNNLFGIKGQYNGQGIKMPTLEQNSDRSWKTIIAEFRKYPSWYESIVDHCELFVRGVSWDKDKYKKVLQAKNYLVGCAALQASGYATDQGYGEKLRKLIEQYDLDQYDHQPDTWQQKIMEAAKNEGLISGDHNPMEAAPKWFVLQVVRNALGKRG